MREGKRKRKAEDVELDGGAVVLALNAWRTVPFEDCNDVRAAIRTYIAEADLIERPATVEEWAALMPVSVWGGTEADRIIISLEGKNATGSLWKVDSATIPRPQPAKLTDEEIDARAREAALNGVSQYQECARAIDVYFAEKSRLEKERGE